MQHIPPKMITVSPQPDEDRSRNRGPDYLQPIIPMAIRSRDTLPGPIFNDEENVNDLSQNKDTAGKKEDKIDELVDVYAPFAGVLRHPPKIRSPRIGPAGSKPHQQNRQDQAASSKRGSPETHKETRGDLKYGTEVLVIVIKGEAPPEDWWGEAPERL